MTQWNKNVQEKAWADGKETTTQVAVVCGILSNISMDYAACASSNVLNENKTE